MYIQIYGPNNPIYTFLDDGKNMMPSFEVYVSALSEALDEYSARFNVTLLANGICEDPSMSEKYFIHTDLQSGKETLVDIHVLRGVKEHIINGGESICIEQDMDFEIQDQDIINMGPLIC